MRLSITVPDEFYSSLKVKLSSLGFTSFNDFVLDCIRDRMNQSGAEFTKSLLKIPTLHQNGTQITSPNIPKSKNVSSSKKTSCPHFIIIGGYCRKCGGLAK